jgi:hypothetical protein
LPVASSDVAVPALRHRRDRPQSGIHRVR